MRHLVEDIMLSDAVMGLRDAENLMIARMEFRCDDGVYIFIYSTTQYLTHYTNISSLSLRQLKCQLLNSRLCSKELNGTSTMPKSLPWSIESINGSFEDDISRTSWQHQEARRGKRWTSGHRERGARPHLIGYHCPQRPSGVTHLEDSSAQERIHGRR